VITVEKFIKPNIVANACACLRSIVFGIFLFFFYPVADVFSQTTLVVSSQAWSGLNQAEREIIQSKHIVQAIGSESFGVIIDTQGIDRSTPGNTAGSNLGQAFGSATYIDRSIAGGNYSARNHLGAMIIGSMIGSAFDSPRTEKYQFRYAIRLGTGGIVYQDIISDTPFRHPAGVCVMLPQVALASDQGMCTQTSDILRRNYVDPIVSTPSQTINARNERLVESESKSINSINSAQVNTSNSQDENSVVNCRFGALPPVRATREKCQNINGVIE
jgi:hypothetical protein